MHERVSIHQICFPDAGLSEYVRKSLDLGARRISFSGPALLADGGEAEARGALAGSGLQIETVAHVFRAGPLSWKRESWVESRESLARLIDVTAGLGAGSIYMLTGGHGGLSWEDAADCFSEAIAPCVEHARAAGVGLAIENASSLYADVHIAHTLADTISLAERAGLGVCIELFFCWAEADLPTLFARALPRCQLVQLSDYVYGDRSLPARAVPGDGAIPLESLLQLLLDLGYGGSFELEMLGPRIAEEGSESAVARAAAYVSELLSRLEVPGD